jgi:hypothetical protein
MVWLLTKYLITAAIIVAVTEAAKHSGRLGALITALPLVAVLALIWMFVEKQPADRIGTYAYYTFWYVLPTLPMFLVFPIVLKAYGFWPAMAAGAALTIVLFAILAWILRLFGIALM